MIKPKKLIEMARRWQRVATLGRRRIFFTKSNAFADDANCTTSIAEKDHFIVYTVEGKRFMVPLAYLRSSIFVELFKMSEDEFGLPGDGPITLPFDAVFMSILSLFRRRVSKIWRGH